MSSQGIATSVVPMTVPYGSVNSESRTLQTVIGQCAFVDGMTECTINKPPVGSLVSKRHTSRGFFHDLNGAVACIVTYERGGMETFPLTITRRQYWCVGICRS
jgi:hypothetical protein